LGGVKSARTVSRPAAARPGTAARTGTSARILDVAERLVQTRGFNAFSYADIAAALGVRKASLHHHFASKSELGLAVIGRYRADFLAALERIEGETPDGRERLRRYAELYGSVLRRKRMCLCGMMAADVATLPRPLRESLTEFFRENESWLERILDGGRDRGELSFEGSAASLAAFVVGSLEGAMLVARGSGRMEEFDAAADRLLALLAAGASPRKAGAKARKV
jgi:TetR/AcrR family transcriptional repressor of nem operon